jgi:hypothetical protein
MLAELIGERMVPTIAVLPKVHDVRTFAAVKAPLPATGNGFERSTTLQFSGSQEITTLVSPRTFPVHILSGSGTEVNTEASSLIVLRRRYDPNGENPGIIAKIPLTGMRISDREYFEMIDHIDDKDGGNLYLMLYEVFDQYKRLCKEHGLAPFNPLSFSSYVSHIGIEGKLHYESIQQKNYRIARHICELLEGPALLLEQTYGMTGGLTPDTYTRYDALRKLMTTDDLNGKFPSTIASQLRQSIQRAKILSRIVENFHPKPVVTIGAYAEHALAQTVGEERMFFYDRIERDQLGHSIVTRLCTPIFP